MDDAAQFHPGLAGRRAMNGMARKAVPYGWCPTAYRPMAAEDGLLVRVRPFQSRVTAAQMGVICDVAERFGNGLMEFTIRSNIQLRGARDDGHAAILQALAEADLLDADTAAEHRRSILMTPLWQPGDLSVQLHDALLPWLHLMPELPAKMGIGIDCGPVRQIADGSADFRFEQGAAGGLILRADGAAAGVPVDLEDAPEALSDMAQWFLDSGGAERGRMARHIEVPGEWRVAAPAPVAARLDALPHGVIDAPAGAHKAADVRALMTASGARAVRLTPWRAILLEDADLASLPHPWEERALTPPATPDT